MAGNYKDLLVYQKAFNLAVMIFKISETRAWLDFALSFGFLKQEIHIELYGLSEEIGRLLNHMMQHPEKYRGSMKTKK